MVLPTRAFVQMLHLTRQEAFFIRSRSYHRYGFARIALLTLLYVHISTTLFINLITNNLKNTQTFFVLITSTICSQIVLELSRHLQLIRSKQNKTLFTTHFSSPAWINNK